MCTSGRIPPNFRSIAVGLCVGLAILFQATAPALCFQEKTAAAQSDQAEVTSNDTEPAFRLKTERNLVVVRVVVRDSTGAARAGLRKEDFRLLDNGRPQTITHFAVETAQSATQSEKTSSDSGSTVAHGQPTDPANSSPRRFLALFFDDIHIQIGDLMRVQQAAIKYLAHAVLPGDRVGVFTASGQNISEFTDDQNTIRQAIQRIFPRPIISTSENSCPQIFDYQAYLIVEQHDQFATEAAVEEYYHCHCEQLEGQSPQLAAQCRAQGTGIAEAEAARAQQVYETNTEATIRTLEGTVRHLAAFPGQRTLVLVSPGFLTRTFEIQLDGIVDRALRAGIVINALDSKGLYAPLPGGDDIATNPVITPRRPDLIGHKEQYRLDRLLVADEPLTELSSGTGGIFFHNSNDLDAGFERTGTLPAVFYTLSYSPDNLKQDGKFHSLKVSLTEPEHLAVQARRGYFAPNGNLDPEVKAKNEIEDAVFSQEDINELPIDVHTQFFRVDNDNAKLSVMTHVDLRQVHFRKQEGRNVDHLTLVTVLFDHDGKYVQGLEKILQLRLKDSSLEHFARSGITMKTSFDVKPGTYVIRQVVRDAEGEQLSGLSRPIEIQ